MGRQIGRVFLKVRSIETRYNNGVASGRPVSTAIRPPIATKTVSNVSGSSCSPALTKAKKVALCVTIGLAMADQKAIATAMRTAGVNGDMRAQEMVDTFLSKGFAAELGQDGVIVVIGEKTYSGGVRNYALVLASAFMRS